MLLADSGYSNRYKFLEEFFKFYEIYEEKNDGTYIISFTCLKCLPISNINVQTTNISLSNLGKHIYNFHPNHLSAFGDMMLKNKVAIKKLMDENVPKIQSDNISLFKNTYFSNDEKALNILEENLDSVTSDETRSALNMYSKKIPDSNSDINQSKIDSIAIGNKEFITLKEKSTKFSKNTKKSNHNVDAADKQELIENKNNITEDKTKGRVRSSNPTKKGLSKTEGKKEYSLICSICKARFTMQFILDRHIDVAHEGKINEEIINSNVENKGIIPSKLKILSDHIKLKNKGEKRMSCKICSYKATKKWNLDLHIASVHKEKKPFSCKLCNSSFDKIHNMKKHFALNHEGTTDKVLETTNEKGTSIRDNQVKINEGITNPREVIEYPSKLENFKENIKLVHDIIKEFNHKLKLANSELEKAKIIQKHFDPKNGNLTMSKFITKLFTDSTKINKSMLSKWFKKYGLQKFKCKLCKRKFLSEDSLQEHIKMIHESNKKSETFIDKNASDPVKIRKEIAKNAISINSQSKNEETANTIEENDKNNSEVRIHPLQEQCWKSYRCNYCPRRFLYEIDLKSHSMSIHGKKYLNCRFCQYTFPNEESWKKHVKLVHEENKYEKCNTCNKIIARKNLEKHIKVDHKGEKTK